MVGFAGNWIGTVSKRAQRGERRGCWGCSGGEGQGGGEGWGSETPHTAGGGGSTQRRKHLKMVSCSCLLEDQTIQLEQDKADFLCLKYENDKISGLWFTSQLYNSDHSRFLLKVR